MTTKKKPSKTSLPKDHAEFHATLNEDRRTIVSICDEISGLPADTDYELADGTVVRVYRTDYAVGLGVYELSNNDEEPDVLVATIMPVQDQGTAAWDQYRLTVIPTPEAPAEKPKP